MRKPTVEWVKRAEEDYLVAQNSSRSKSPLHRTVCFHCQQCVEKYLKALLVDLSIVPPKTHDLEDLLNLLMPHHPVLRSHRRGLVYLTGFAVHIRYPGRHLSKRQAEAALRWAERIRTECRSLLNIRPPRPKKKAKP